MARKQQPGDLRRPVMASSAAVVACFILATAFAEYRTRLGGHPAVELASTISPRIEQLASAVVRLQDLEAAVDQHIRERVADSRGPAARLLTMSEGVGDTVHSYASNESARLGPDERRALSASQRTLAADLADLLQAPAQRRSKPSEQAALDAFTEAIHREQHHLSEAIQVESTFARLEAERLSTARHRRMILVALLDFVSVIMAVILTRLALRAAVAQQQLQRARSDELESFAGRVAHDILGPVAAAEMSATSAIRGSEGAQQHFALARVVRNLRRARQIADALLEFARAGARPRLGEITPVRQAIDEAIADISEEARALDIDIIAGRIVATEVACSGGALASILGNLIRNSLRYMGEGAVRRIYLRAEGVDRFVRLEVEDTGPGLPADAGMKLFEPFVRGGNAIGDGVGLGLATVKRLVEAHGGSLGARKGEQGGCLVWLELPEVLRPEPVISRESAQPAASPGA